MRLSGKVAFVTGAGGGIARAICEQFLSEGAQVIATDIDLDGAQEAIASAPERGLALHCDAGDSDGVRNAIRQGAERFGGLNVLCAVAGGSTREDSGVVDATEDEFWRVIRLDLFGTFLVGKFGIPELIKAGGGSVINFASMCGLIGTPDKDCYTAAKGGIIAMTRSMAVNYAAQGIRVNTIAPGLTLTPRVLANPVTPFRSIATERHLLGLCTPDDSARMAVYLASDDSLRVTGQILRVDSGATIH